MIIQAMMLLVAQDNRAVNLYQRQGYTVVENEDGCLYTWCAVGIRVITTINLQFESNNFYTCVCLKYYQ